MKINLTKNVHFDPERSQTKWRLNPMFESQCSILIETEEDVREWNNFYNHQSASCVVSERPSNQDQAKENETTPTTIIRMA